MNFLKFKIIIHVFDMTIFIFGNGVSCVEESVRIDYPSIVYNFRNRQYLQTNYHKGYGTYEQEKKILNRLER